MPTLPSPEAEAPSDLPAEAPPPGFAHQAPDYLRANLGLTAVLLALWFGVTFVVAYFARELAFDFFGWPFSFWVGAQGALVAYWLITWIYARRMNRLDAASTSPGQD